MKIGDKIQVSWPGEGGQGPVYTIVGFDERGWLILDDGDTIKPKTMVRVEPIPQKPPSAPIAGVIWLWLAGYYRHTVVCDFCNRRRLKTSMIKRQGHFFCDETELENLRLRDYGRC